MNDAKVINLVMRVATDDSDQNVRARAAIAASFLGESGEPAIPLLLKILRDADGNRDVTRLLLAHAASNALARIGKPAVPPLCKVLEDKSESLQARMAAAETCGFMKESGAASVPYLIQAALDPDVRIRMRAIRSLGYIGSKTNVVRKTILSACKDSSADVRTQALQTIRLLDMRDHEDFAVVVGLLHDVDPAVVAHACEVASELTRDAPDADARLAVGGLIQGLDNADPIVRRTAARCLGNLGPIANVALPALDRLSRDEDKSVAETGLKALERIRKKAEK
jgi:HEAT repeat protein